MHPIPEILAEGSTSAYDDPWEPFNLSADGNYNSTSASNLQRWKRATLALNAARRFRYSGESKSKLKHLRKGKPERYHLPKHFQDAGYTRTTHITKNDPESRRCPPNSIQAVDRLQQGMIKDSGTCTACSIPSEELEAMVQEHNLHTLQKYGGTGGLACELNTSLDEGLHDDSRLIQKRREEYGANIYLRKPPKGFFTNFLGSCKLPANISFIVWAVHSLASGIRNRGIKEGWYDGAAIALAVIFSVIVTAFREYKLGLQVRKLSKGAEQNFLVDVSRGGRRMEIPILDVVVGEIVHLKSGDQVPADGLFLKGHSLLMDTSTITGESDPVSVKHGMPFLHSGSKVIGGVATMLVTGVGMKTEWGGLMAELEEEGSREETPLQVRLEGVTTFVRHLGLAITLLVLVFLDFAERKEDLNNCGQFKARYRAVLDTTVVLLLPNPIAVTWTLAYAMKWIMLDNVFVKGFSACETMGSITTICFDKTGTLTSNEMAVEQAWVAGDFQNVKGDGLCSETRSLIIEGIAQNTFAAINKSVEGKELEVIGIPTEKALLDWGLKLGMDVISVKACSEVLQAEPFDSTKRKAGVVVRVAESGNLHVHWKGATETILRECDTVLGRDSYKQPLTARKRQELLNLVNEMGASGLRCLAFGFREVEELNGLNVPEGPLTLIAIIGLKDPCKPGVAEAMQKCQEAGLKVCMITGDNLATAKAIAGECHILQSESKAIEGATFQTYTAERRWQELPRIAVVARSCPSDKLILVKTLRQHGEVVAVIGDGLSDVPALREADIGLSMGIQGTEVAKESSDIIIMDDNFASVVKLVRWGRSIDLNIQKYIQFQLTMNVVTMTVNFTSVVLWGDVLLTPIQILWMNIIMATLVAFALAMEPPTYEVLQRPPVRSGEPLISKFIIRNIVVQALYQVIILLFLHFKGKDMLGLKGPDAMDVKRTVLFNAYVLCQLFNVVNARKLEAFNILKGFFDNRPFVGILCGSLALQVIAVEFLNKFASTVKLSWEHWLLCIGIGFLSWPVALLGKLISVKKKKSLVGPCRKNNEAGCGLQRKVAANAEWIAAIC